MTYYKDIDLKKSGKKDASTNFLAPNNFELVIDNLTFPNVSYFVTNVNVPSFNINRTDTGFATRTAHLHADKVQYDDLTVSFLVDEDMQNYLELHDWMLAQVIQNDNYPSDSKRRDIKIIMNTSHNNKTRIITVQDAFPTNLSDIQLDSQITDIGYVTCTATFAYSYFTIS